MFQAFDMTRDDVVMTVFPIFGCTGFAWIIGAMLYGVPNVLANFEPNEILRRIGSERVTMVNLVSTMASMMLSAQATTPHDLSSLRAVLFCWRRLCLKKFGTRNREALPQHIEAAYRATALPRPRSVATAPSRVMISPPLSDLEKPMTKNAAVAGIDRRTLVSGVAAISAGRALTTAAQAQTKATSPGLSFAVCGDSRPMMYLPYKDGNPDLVRLFVEMFGLVMPERVAEEVVKRDVKMIVDPVTKDLVQIIMPFMSKSEIMTLSVDQGWVTRATVEDVKLLPGVHREMFRL